MYSISRKSATGVVVFVVSNLCKMILPRCGLTVYSIVALVEMLLWVCS